jgi:hypothetical protein
MNWQLRLGGGLVLLSGLIYLALFALSREGPEILTGFMERAGFLPIQVLFMTLIVNQLLVMRDKKAKLNKLNMVIGVFFSEVGTEMLSYISDFDPELDRIRDELIVKKEWTDNNFRDTKKNLSRYKYDVDIHKCKVEVLRGFLLEKRNFILRLLENPTLLENESFSDLLRAVLHLCEELTSRKDLGKLPESDFKHLAGDTRRAYHLLVREWLEYMRYLKGYYPFLFSLAMRLNPFDQHASPIVTDA